MEGTGYEYCNCDFGCGCNFGGFPNSDDGSFRALVGVKVAAENSNWIWYHFDWSNTAS